MVSRLKRWAWCAWTVASFVSLFATPAEAYGAEIPLVLIIASIAVSAASAGYGAYAQGQAQKEQAEFQSKMSEYQATEAAAAASRAREQGEKFASYQEAEADRIRQQAEYEARAAEIAGQASEASATEASRRARAHQHLLIGSSGISAEGSPLLALMAGEEQAELEVERIRYGTSLEAYAARTRGYAGGRDADIAAWLSRTGSVEQALNYQRQAYVQQGMATQYGSAGTQAEKAGYIGAGTSILAGAARIYGAYNAPSSSTSFAATGSPGYQQYRIGERGTY
jgi:hypothetical protein